MVKVYMLFLNNAATEGDFTEKNTFIDFYLDKWNIFDLTKTSDRNLVKSVDLTTWIDLAINDPSIKTDPLKFTPEKLEEVITWIQTNY